MFRLLGRVSLIGLMLVSALGQPAPAPLAFAVASVRPHQGPLQRIFSFSSSGPRVTLEGYLATYLITEAYNLKTYQVSFASSVPQTDMTYYDIVAKAEGEKARTRDEFRQMLQTLLAERFHMKAHREKQDKPVYALVVSKNGPKLKESASDAVFASHTGVNGRNQNITASKATMEFLAKKIVSDFFVDRPVVDRTGLTGTYDFKIEATPEFRINNNAEPGEVRIFTAIQEQLGLKLEPQKSMVEMLIVDSLEKPSAN